MSPSLNSAHVGPVSIGASDIASPELLASLGAPLLDEPLDELAPLVLDALLLLPPLLVFCTDPSFVLDVRSSVFGSSRPAIIAHAATGNAAPHAMTR